MIKIRKIENIKDKFGIFKKKVSRPILGILKIKYKTRNCKGELWEWKGFN